MKVYERDGRRYEIVRVQGVTRWARDLPTGHWTAGTIKKHLEERRLQGRESWNLLQARLGEVPVAYALFITGIGQNELAFVHTREGHQDKGHGYQLLLAVAAIGGTPVLATDATVAGNKHMVRWGFQKPTAGHGMWSWTDSPEDVKGGR